MKDKAIVKEPKEGIRFRPLPSSSSERGSLRNLLGDKTIKELLEEVRTYEKGD